MVYGHGIAGHIDVTNYKEKNNYKVLNSSFKLYGKFSKL